MKLGKFDLTFFCYFTCVILYCWLRTVESGSSRYPLEGAAAQTTACPEWLNGNGRTIQFGLVKIHNLSMLIVETKPCIPNQI